MNVVNIKIDLKFIKLQMKKFIDFFPATKSYKKLAAAAL